MSGKQVSNGVGRLVEEHNSSFEAGVRVPFDDVLYALDPGQRVDGVSPEGNICDMTKSETKCHGSEVAERAHRLQAWA